MARRKEKVPVFSKERFKFYKIYNVVRIKQRQQEQQDFLASLSSLVRDLLNPIRSTVKKLTPICKSFTKQALLPPITETKNLPEREENIVSVVTATKQKNESSEEEDSTGSDLSVIQAKASTLSIITTINSQTGTSTTSNLSSMSNPRLDTKLEHFLTHYFFAISSNHKI